MAVCSAEDAQADIGHHFAGLANVEREAHTFS